MTEWKEYKLGEIVTFQRGHDLPKDKMIDGDIPVAGSNGIIGYHNQFTKEGPGVTIGRSGNIGIPHYYPNAYWAHNTVLYIVDFKGNDAKFMYYLLKTFDFTQLNTGSAVPSLNRNHIHELPVSIPDVSTQHRIAAILSSLDDKIDLLHRENATLEQMAETIFRQWFVVEAKEEWEEGKLGDICNYVTEKIDIGNVETGDYISTENMCSNKQGVVQASSVPGNGKATKFRIDDVLLSNIRPYFKKIWLADREGGCSADVLCIRSKNELYAFFSYYTIRQDEFFDYVMLGSKGCKMPRGDKSHIMNWPIIIPPKDELLKFNEIAKQGITKIRNNNKQIQTLIQTRDGLLPKLMSNEIKI